MKLEGLPNSSYKPITNTAWVRAQLCNLQKGCTRLTAASDQAYQLLAQGRWLESGVKHHNSLNPDMTNQISRI
jgi:hypothetical protein